MTTKEQYFSPEFLQEFARINEERNKKLIARKKAAQESVKKIADFLKKDYQVKKVYLYGSLASGEFTLTSDIDLFIVGFSGNYWRALSTAQAIAGTIEVSLACEEDCYPELLQEVYAKGVEI